MTFDRDVKRVEVFGDERLLEKVEGGYRLPDVDGRLLLRVPDYFKSHVKFAKNRMPAGNHRA